MPIDIYLNLERDWFELVNKVLFLSNTDFETFEKRYFSTTSTLGGVKSEELAFYSQTALSDCQNLRRNYADRMKAIELLGMSMKGKTKIKVFFIFR